MEFIVDNIWWIGLVLLSGTGLVWSSMEGRGSRLSLIQATQLINQDKAVVVDVRPANEFAQGHIPGALNFPLSELPVKVGQLNKYQSSSIILVCATGMQSAKARLQLRKLGFNEAYVLDGGIAAWQSQGLPTTK